MPQSGIYTITHDAAHANMPHEVTVMKGRRFPTCRHCKGVRFELAHTAKHVGEIDRVNRYVVAVLLQSGEHHYNFITARHEAAW